jgi:hypothetical protein
MPLTLTAVVSVSGVCVEELWHPDYVSDADIQQQ